MKGKYIPKFGLFDLSLLTEKVALKSQLALPLSKCRRYSEFIEFFSVNRSSLSVGTTEGSAESLAEGTFGRSLPIIYQILFSTG